MKKLLFVFVTLFMLILTSGCGAQKNTVRFNGDSEPTEKEDTEVSEVSEEAVNDGEADETDASESKDEPDLSAGDLAETPTGKLSVTSFDGAYLKTNLSFNVVKGTAPAGTHSIKINDYKLTKYIPGQTKWDYIAAARFGTLTNGLNTYVVKTFDADGGETDSLIFSINYEAPAVPSELPGVGVSHWLTLLTTLMVSGIYMVFRKYRWL